MTTSDKTTHRIFHALSVSVIAALAGSASAQVAMEADGTYKRPAPRAGHYIHSIPTGSGDMIKRRADARGVAHSVAREWNEIMLECIRNDKARPTVHARNLYNVSAAMWDAWVAYETIGDQLFHTERQTAVDVEAAREEAISYAVYRVLIHRFTPSVGAAESIPLINGMMTSLGYDPMVTTVVGDTPAALGNRIGAAVIQAGLTDGANEQIDYNNLFYTPVNDPLFPEFPGNPDIVDLNRWQPLAIEFFVDQAGNPVPLGSLSFLSPEWGAVTPFALRPEDATTTSRDGFDYIVYHDPGDPPFLNGVGDDYYRTGNEMVVVWSGHLDPDSTDPTNPGGALIDISPNNFGNSPLPGVDDWPTYYNFLDGGDSGTGWDTNPATGMPYPAQNVPLGDYGRILAEFWADGPDSETPPGHWNTIANFVFDHPLFERRFAGQGDELPQLEWDIKAYLLLNAAMHDCAITAWGCKGLYDYIRPVSVLRWQADQGQSSDPMGPSYHPDGISLIPGIIEVCTLATTAPGERHEHLAGNEGEIVARAWQGPDFIADEETDTADVGWILLSEWWPYQRPSFVTPPFAGFVSGHSTYSRGAAEIMTYLTGDEFFPGGVGEFFAPMNEFLVFEDGPSQDITLQWATYRDASDQTSLSRIWGGIHPPADDLPGRIMGLKVAQDVWPAARRVFNGQVSCPADLTGDGNVNFNDVVAYLNAFAAGDLIADNVAPFRELDFNDVIAFLTVFSAGCP